MNRNRLALYVFWEKDGEVRDYVTYYLKGLQEVARTVVLIANGGVNAAGLEKLEKMGVEVLQRENHGLDFAAWKAALLQRGWDNVQTYDELILCNCSCYGPVYPFSEVFERMAQKGCDFWSMLCHPRKTTTETDGKGLYMKSSFMVFRKSVLLSNVFRRWMTNNLKKGHENISDCEFSLSRALIDEGGFDFFCAYDKSKCDALTPNMEPGVYCAEFLLQDRIPLVQRNLFDDYQQNMLSLCEGRIPRACMNYIREHTDYPEDFIYNDLLSRMRMSDIRDTLHLNYILPSAGTSDVTLNVDAQEIALICYAYYPDLATGMCRYIGSMPRESTIYIISPRQDTLDAYAEILSRLNFRHVHYIIKENRGRDIAALCITSKEIMQKHKYICYIHDKKTSQARPLPIRDFTAHLMQCCLHSEEYVKSVIGIFENNPRIGLLVPPTPNYGGICPLGAEMYGNEESVRIVYEMLGLVSPPDKALVAPFGTCFWTRGKAIMPLYNYNWQHSDFPQEPLAADGTISHGVERILPLVAQTAGYCTAWSSPDEFASLYMSNNTVMLREFNRALIARNGLKTWFGMLHLIRKPALDVETLKSEMVRKGLKYGRKKAQFRFQNILSLGLTRRRNKKKLRQYKKDLGLE